MNEMVERVAKALEQFQLEEEPCCLCSTDIRYEIARAIISDMREPTAAMVDAAQVKHLDIVQDASGFTQKALAPDVFRAMIDEALK